MGLCHRGLPEEREANTYGGLSNTEGWLVTYPKGYKKKNFTLYWTSLARYEDCPQQQLWGRGWGTIDVGGGPGRKKPVPFKRSEHHAVMGTALQEPIERFYNDELWRFLRGQQLIDRLMELTDEALAREIARRYIDWRLAPPRSEVVKTVKDGVMGYLRTLKAHKLLGPYARGEVELLGYVDQYTPIGGRADMIIRRDKEPYVGVTILDGKNSKRYKDGKGGLMTYTDPDQLRWYALCYYLSYRKLPDRLGFVYFRYPYGDPVLDVDGNDTGEKESGVTWVEFDKDDIRGIAQRARNAVRGMEKQEFDPTPKPKVCRFCDYETVCDARKAQKVRNRRSPGKGGLHDTDGVTIMELK